MNWKVCITLSLIFLLDLSDTCFLPEFKDHFDSHDHNGNGVWDQDEFCEYAKGEEECENAMNELDLNRNGTITCQGMVKCKSLGKKSLRSNFSQNFGSLPWP